MPTRNITTKVAITGESEYRNALKKINSEYSTLKSQLALVQSQFKDNANSMEALKAKGEALSAMYAAQEQKVKTLQSALENAKRAQAAHAQTSDDLRKQLSEARAEMDKLKNSTGDTAEEQAALEKRIGELNAALAESEAKEEAAARGVNSYQKQANLAQAGLNDLSREIDQNNQYLDEARKSADGCATSIDKYGKQVKEAQQETKKTKNSLQELSDILASAGIAMGLKEIASAMLKCVEAARSFETATAKIYTIADSSSVSLENMRSDLLAMSNELGKSVNDLAEAAYQAISAGVDTANAAEFVNHASRLATAGFTDTTSAVDVLSTALNAYGMEAEQVNRVSDVLVITQKLGKTSVNELAQSIGKVIPTAAAYGVEIEQLGAAYASLTSSGVKTSEATTYINQMLLELADTGSQVSKILREQTGQSFADLMKSGTSLGDIMTILGDSVDGDATSFSNLWSSATAGTSALVLFNAGAEKFNTTLASVAGSAGATEAAFQTMADTSEQAHNRMITAAENLQIVIGDQLAPSYTALNEAGADLLTWASEFIDENEALIPVLASVAAGVGMYTVAIAGLAVIQKIKKYLKDFNKALLTNPYILAAAAVATLTAAVIQYAASLKYLPEETQALIDKVADISDMYEQATGEIADASAANKAYAKSVFDLSAQQKRSTADHELLLEQINRLNEAVPDLNLAWDETTQSLNMTEEAVNSFLETQDRYRTYEEAVRAYTDAENTRIQIEQQLAEAQKELAAIEEDGNTVVMAGLDGRLVANDTYLAAKNRVDELTSALEANTASQEKYRTAVEENKRTTDDYAEAIEEALGPQLYEMRVRLNELNAEYAKIRETARNSIDQQISAWQKMDNQSRTSAATLNEALLSQIDYLNNYSSNMDSLLARNVDGVDELAEKFSDGSEESAAALAGLAEASDEEIAEIIANMKRVDEGKEGFVDSIAGIHPELVREMNKLKEEMAKKKEEIRQALNDQPGFEQIGVLDISGYIRGMLSMKAAAASAAAEISRASQNAMKNTSQQKSPSKAYEKIADYDAMGYIKGWEKKRQAVLDEIKLQGETNIRAMQARFPTHEAIQAGFRSAENNRISEITSSFSSGNSEMSALLASVNRKLDRILAGSDSVPSYKIYLDDGVLAGHLAPAMDDALGDINRLKERGQ